MLVLSTFFSSGKGASRSQGLNNLAEESSIMKSPPEGCVSPPAVPVPRPPAKRRQTQAPQIWLRGISAERGGVDEAEGGRGFEPNKTRGLRIHVIYIIYS